MGRVTCSLPVSSTANYWVDVLLDPPVGANEIPTITSNGGGDTAAVSIAENTTAVTTVTATDPMPDRP